jgi:hypothetical protein
MRCTHDDMMRRYNHTTLAVVRKSNFFGALLLTAFLAAGIRDDLSDLNDQIARMAANEPALKRVLLESGTAFEELVKAAKDWKAAHWD